MTVCAMRSDCPSAVISEGAEVIRCVIPALPEAVSVALLGLMRNAALARFDADSRSTLELVLAEVLNNVVEHAYAHYPGSIEVMLWPGADGIRGCIVDSGLPMPNGQVPAGDPPDLVGDLPEGGFGWYLIRSLTTGLDYRRVANRNHLQFTLPM
jgi:serine/threonine-protein kinase RsbW